MLHVNIGEPIRLLLLRSYEVDDIDIVVTVARLQSAMCRKQCIIASPIGMLAFRVRSILDPGMHM